jgi:hypothetical protein
MPLLVSQHESLAAMVDSVLAIPERRRAKANRRLAEADFVGRQFADLHEASAAIHQDWPEGSEMIDSLRRELQGIELPQAKLVRRQRCWSADNGDAVDNDRLRAGQDYWASMTKVACASPRLVNIHVGATAAASRNTRDILWRGAAALVLVEWLQNNGYRVRITAYMLNSELYYTVPGPSNGLVTCVLKQHADPLNISLLVNALSGWCYRTTWFASKTHGSAPYDSGLGGQLIPDAQITAEYFPDSLGCDGFFSKQGAAAWLQTQAGKFSE